MNSTNGHISTSADDDTLPSADQNSSSFSSSSFSSSSLESSSSVESASSDNSAVICSSLDSSPAGGSLPLASIDSPEDGLEELCQPLQLPNKFWCDQSTENMIHVCKISTDI